jgi:hypothetical protein
MDQPSRFMIAPVSRRPAAGPRTLHIFKWRPRRPPHPTLKSSLALLITRLSSLRARLRHCAARTHP